MVNLAFRMAFKRSLRWPFIENSIGANKPALLTMIPNFDRGRMAVVDSAAGIALELEEAVSLRNCHLV